LDASVSLSALPASFKCSSNCAVRPSVQYFRHVARIQCFAKNYHSRSPGRDRSGQLPEEIYPEWKQEVSFELQAEI
jgi:hypothetical protein